MVSNRAQWLTEDGFARQEELTFSQCDAHQIARPATLIKACAALAGHHCDAKGMDYDTLAQEGHAFLLSRLAIHVHTMPKNRQIVTIRTWENGTKGPYFHRVFEWYDEAGGLLVSAKSEWIMVDPVSHKICRPQTTALAFGREHQKEVDCANCQKLSLPKDGTQALGTYQVRWSDLDGNGHLHSGNYGDIFWDFLPEEWQSRPLDTLHITFQKEAYLGQEIHLCGTSTSHHTYLVEGKTAHNVCFCAQCTFKTD